MPLPSPIPAVFSGLLALLGLLAAVEAGRQLRARGPNPAATHLAGMFLVLTAVHLLECALASSGWARFAPHLHSTTFGLAYGFGAAVWILARRIARVGPGRVPNWIHFLPILVGTTSLAAWFRTPAAGKIAYFHFLTAARPRSLAFGGMISAQALILLGFLYAAAAERVLRERSREEGTEEGQRLALERLAGVARRGRNAFAVYLLAFLAIEIVGWHTYQLEYMPSLIGSVLLLGIAAALRTAPAIPESTGRTPRGPGRYRKAPLPPERAAELVAGLKRKMEQDRPYLDPELSLSALASSLGITAHQLSQLLNRELGSSFADYVNGYRVREASRILRNPECRELTILAVALDVGFRSKNTFNSAFRKHTGTTPSELRDR